MDRFSSRHDAEINIRHDAPVALREAIFSIAYSCGFKPCNLRSLLYTIRYRAPDRSNWSKYPNIDGEVRALSEQLKWFEVYDLIEALAGTQRRGERAIGAEPLVPPHGGGVATECAAPRPSSLRCGTASISCGSMARPRPRRSHEALRDLSRRPEPEVTVTIQHALSALECVARDACGSKDTRGDLVRRNPGIFPKPVDELVSKSWGYTSNFGRHFQEGRPPQFEEAELMVGACGSLCRNLARRVPAGMV